MEKFRKWDVDITPHRQLIKQGFETQDGKRLDIDMAFKKEEHPFRIAIVCAMWLTGFDVPSLATLYLDKPLKAHTLMQAIARANRVSEGKNNGLIVDYCGILKNLRIALATFAGHKGDNGGRAQPGVDPVKPADEELLGALEEAIAMVRGFLETHNFGIEDVLEKTGFERNKSIADAKEIINKNTTVANLKDAIEKRLDRMIQQNPLRTDFQEHYEKIVSEYNSEKEATRDSIKIEIHNCLYNDATGLPESYTEDEISQNSEKV
jgi:superfamily II DNA or RNA helicase